MEQDNLTFRFLWSLVTFYIPDKDKDGNEIADHERWITDIAKILSNIARGEKEDGGGATILRAEGYWLAAGKDKEEIIKEKTALVYSYVDPDKFLKNIKDLVDFACRFGRDTNQDAVIFICNNVLFQISDYEDERHDVNSFQELIQKYGTGTEVDTRKGGASLKNSFKNPHVEHYLKNKKQS